MSYKNLTFVFALGCLSAVGHATILTASLTCDDDYEAYISTDPNVQGTMFMENFGIWNSVETGSTALTAGMTNYLHIRARNNGGPSMFIGSLSLDDSDFEFASTGGQTSDTGDSNWLISLTSFTSGLVTPDILGNNGLSPWGTQTGGITGAAKFIWTGSTTDTAERFLTVQINAVPEPATMTLLGLGALAFLRKKRA